MQKKLPRPPRQASVSETEITKLCGAPWGQGLPEAGRAVVGIDRASARCNSGRIYPARASTKVNAMNMQSQPPLDETRIAGDRVRTLRIALGLSQTGAREADRRLLQPSLGDRARENRSLAPYRDHDRRRARHLGGLPRGPGRRPETGPRDSVRAEDEDRTHPRPRRGPRGTAGPRLAGARRHRPARHHGRGRQDGPRGDRHRAAEVPLPVAPQARTQSPHVPDRPHDGRSDGADDYRTDPQSSSTPRRRTAGTGASSSSASPTSRSSGA